MKTKFLHVRFKASALKTLIETDFCNGVMFHLLKKSYALGDPPPIDVETGEKLSRGDWPKWQWPQDDDEYVRDEKECVILIGKPTYSQSVPGQPKLIVIGENLPENRKRKQGYEYIDNFPKKFNLMFFWKVQIEFLLGFHADIILSGVMAFFGSDWRNRRNERMKSKFFLMKAEPEGPLDIPNLAMPPRKGNFHAFHAKLGPITEPYFQLAQPCPPNWDEEADGQ